VDIELRMLGPVEVRLDGVPVDLGPPKRRVVLAMLAAGAGSPVPVEALIDELWGNDPPRSARANLRTYVASLRASLPTTPHWQLASVHDSYVLRIGDVRFDADEFRRHTDAGRAALTGGDTVTAALKFERALALWRGRCGEDIPRGPYLSIAFAVLDEQRVAAYEDYVEARLAEAWRSEGAAAHHDELLPLLRRLTAEHPLRERLWGQLMLALYRAGDVAGALKTFTAARAAFTGELGIEPGAYLQQLHRSMLDRDPRLGETGTARPAGRGISVASPVPRELPPAPAVFVARTQEMARLDEILACAAIDGRARVVAIHGPGGVGKSALAITAAHRHAGAFQDGQLYVDLRGATTVGLRPLDPAEALGRLLRALGVPPAAVPTDIGEASALYRSQLADRSVLIVADNAASAEQVEPLIPAAGRSAVMVTSRRILGNLDGAIQLPLAELSQDESVGLLHMLTGQGDDAGHGTDGVGSDGVGSDGVGSDGVGTDRVSSDGVSTDAVSAVVRHCGGLPLALRIAAARLVSRPDWTFNDLARRLGDTQRSLAEFELGSSGVRRSLQVSYRELEQSSDPTDRLATRALRAAGAVHLEAYTPALIGSLLDEPPPRARAILDRMVEARLADGAADRYSMHDLVRRFAAELAAGLTTDAGPDDYLFRALSWYARHARRVTELFRPEIARLTPVLGAAEVAVAVVNVQDAAAWLDQEHANLVAIIQQAVQSRAHIPLAAQTVLALYPSLLMRSYARDWETLCRAILSAQEDLEPVVVLKIANFLAVVYRHQSRFVEALECLDLARRQLDRVEDLSSHAHTYEVLAMVQVGMDQDEQAIAHFEQALRLREQGGDPPRHGITLSNAAEVYFKLGRYATAIEYLERSAAIRRAHGDWAGATIATLNLAEVRLDTGDVSGALDALDDSAAHNLDRTDRESARGAHCLRARAYLRMARFDEAQVEMAAAMRLAEAADGLANASDLRNLHAALLAADQHQLAEALAGRLIAIGVSLPATVVS
jgi:DNA-binding SARP family transcriptional activator/Tfp pilus assembly protein PilF